jgi:hypothetical protein
MKTTEFLKSAKYLLWLLILITIPMCAAAQTITSEEWQTAAFSGMISPDTNATKVNIFEIHKKDDYRILRTNQHLKYFDPFQPLYIIVYFWYEGQPGPHNYANAEILRRSPTTWAIISIGFKKKGYYEIAFVNETPDGTVQTAVKYNFLYTSKQDVEPNTITIEKITNQ